MERGRSSSLGAAWPFFAGAALIMVAHGLQGTLIPLRGRARRLPHRRHRHRRVGVLRRDARGLDPLAGPRAAGRPRPGVRRARVARVGVRPHARALRGGRVLDRDAGGDRLLLRRHVRRRRELAQPAGGEPEPRPAPLPLHGHDVRGGRVRAAHAQRRRPGRVRPLPRDSRSSCPSPSSPSSSPRGPAPARAGRGGSRCPELYRASPLGVVAAALTGVVHGGLFGMGPIYAREIGLEVGQVAWFMALATIGALFSQWPLGWLSDRVDRRRVMLGAALVGAAAPAVVAFGLVEPGGSAAFAMMFVLGGAALPLYSLSISHVNELPVAPPDGGGERDPRVRDRLRAHHRPARGRLRPRDDGSAGLPAVPRRDPRGARGVHRLPDEPARGEAGRGAGGLRPGGDAEHADAHRAGGGGGARAGRARPRSRSRSGSRSGIRSRGGIRRPRPVGGPAAEGPGTPEASPRDALS